MSRSLHIRPATVGYLSSLTMDRDCSPALDVCLSSGEELKNFVEDYITDPDALVLKVLRNAPPAMRKHAATPGQMVALAEEERDVSRTAAKEVSRMLVKGAAQREEQLLNELLKAKEHIALLEKKLNGGVVPAPKPKKPSRRK